LSGSNHVCLDAGVLHLPESETHVHLAAGIILVSSTREIDLKFVGTALFGHAPASLQAGTKLPKQ